MGDLDGVEADVEFDFGVADGLASSCDNAATAVDGQAGSRASWTSTGLTDFKGHFFEPDDRSTQPPLGRLVHGCLEFGLPGAGVEVSRPGGRRWRGAG